MSNEEETYLLFVVNFLVPYRDDKAAGASKKESAQEEIVDLKEGEGINELPETSPIVTVFPWNGKQNFQDT